MVNWHDPAVFEKDSFAALKLNHVIAGIYIWETLFTVGFELDVLRGKRPYRRTIWLYLGTRYTALLAFIIYFIDIDSSIKLPCQLVSIASTILKYTSWELASFLIALRVIAIWDRNIFVSSLVMGTWLGDLGLNIYASIELRPKYDPALNVCNLLGVHKVLANVVFMLVVDIVLLMSMLIGLRRYSHRSSTGLWHLLYQQCIIWLFLAAIADVPLLVFIALDLNDAMNDAFSAVTVSIMAIAAGRMYRTLFKHAFPTEYVTSNFSRPNPQCHDRVANIRGHIRGAQSNSLGTVTVSTPDSVFIPTYHPQLDISPPGTSLPKDLDAKIPPPGEEDHTLASLSPDVEQNAHRRLEKTPYYVGGEADSLSGASEQ